uniref:Transcriptional regulator n=1 Tax=Streptomyces sp. NBC_00180 TaxID=2903632 RepID=A0AAU1HN78_9ACTN
MQRIQFTIGDHALEPMQPVGGAHPAPGEEPFGVEVSLQIYADDLGLSLSTVRSYRFAAHRWPEGQRRHGVSPSPRGLTVLGLPLLRRLPKRAVYPQVRARVARVPSGRHACLYRAGERPRRNGTIGQGPRGGIPVFCLTGSVGSEEGQALTVPENAARKRRARELAQRTGVPYTAALRLINAGRVPPEVRLQELQRAYARFGRPVGIITGPSLPGPRLMGAEGFGERLSQVWLGYGQLPFDAFMVTSRPLPGSEPDTGLLVGGLHSYIAQHERYSGNLNPNDLLHNRDHDLVERALDAAQAAPREEAEARFNDGMRPCVRVRVGEFEALEIPYEDGSIVYCGPVHLSETVKFGLAGAG